MAVVELQVAKELVEDFERLKPQFERLNGREVGRRTPPHGLYAVIEMDMADAPDTAAKMDVTLQLVRGIDVRIMRIEYYDKDGQPIPGAGWPQDT